jgi:two-component system, chemotaxis family, protein-glutamate methylesterase/glutaminase
MQQIKVMVIDDSVVMGQVMSEMLAFDPEIVVTAVESDADVALSRLHEQRPDVIVLDADMPRLDSIGFLRRIMTERPTPIVLCAAPTATGSEHGVAALSNGAVQVIAKPKSGLKHFLRSDSAGLIAEVKAAAAAKVGRFPPLPLRNLPPKLRGDAVIGPLSSGLPIAHGQLVAIGGSTGGMQALERILVELPRLSPGLVVVQRMPAYLSSAFVAHLHSICDIDVKLARNGDFVRTGMALIAPPEQLLQVQRNGAGYSVVLSPSTSTNRQSQALDTLFKSVANVAGRQAMGIVLTGAGHDGEQGLQAMRAAGAQTLAESEATCVVYDLPRQALQSGAAQRAVPLQKIAREIQAYSDRVLN